MAKADNMGELTGREREEKKFRTDTRANKKVWLKSISYLGTNANIFDR